MQRTPAKQTRKKHEGMGTGSVEKGPGFGICFVCFRFCFSLAYLVLFLVGFVSTVPPNFICIWSCAFGPIIIFFYTICMTEAYLQPPPMFWSPRR